MDRSDIRSIKRGLRREMRTRRDALSPEQIARGSAEVFAQVLALPEYQAAQVVHTYLTFGNELDVQPIIRHALASGKRIAIPLFIKGSQDTPCIEITSLDEADFYVGEWGLRVPNDIRPVPIGEIGLFLVPLLAFSPTGDAPTLRTGYGKSARLGYGIGYYDRLLNARRALTASGLAQPAPAVGVAFALQHAPTFPIEPHDEWLDGVMVGKDEG